MVPAAWAGAVAVIEVAEVTVNVVAATPPKDTTLAPVKLVPVMVTTVPPAEVAEVATGVVTVTSTVPAAPAGEVAVIEVAEATVKVVAGVAPNLTAVAPVKLVPVMVTEVPPAVEPVVGERAVTVGAA